MQLALTVDLATPAERCWVRASYVACRAQHERPVFRAATPAQRDEALYPWLRHQADELLRRCVVLVASDEGVGLGWLLAERRGDALCVCGLYTKGPFRRLGVATQLLEASKTLFGTERIVYDSFASRVAREWARRLGAPQA